MRTARNLIHMCIDSSQKMVSILDCLLNQGLISTSSPVSSHIFYDISGPKLNVTRSRPDVSAGPFLHYDMEAAFVASTPLILGPVIDPQLSNGNQAWMRRAYAIFDDMITSGNRVAGFRKAELQHLDEVARLVTTGGEYQASGASRVYTGPPMLESAASGSRMTDIGSESELSLEADMLLGDCFLDGLTKESILGVAESITDEDMAWMYDTVVVQDT